MAISFTKSEIKSGIAAGNLSVAPGSSPMPKFREGIIASHDGKAWQWFKVDALTSVLAAFPYVDAVDADSKRTSLRRPRSTAGKREPNYDYKIGSVKIIKAATYVLKYNKDGKFAYNHSMSVSGEKLLATILDRREKAGATKFLLAVDGAEYPLHRRAVDEALVAAKLVTEQSPSPTFVNAKVALSTYLDGSFTWFSVIVNGAAIADDAAMANLLGAEWRKVAKEKFGKGNVRYSDKRGQWCIPGAIVAPMDLAAYFDAGHNVADVELTVLPNRERDQIPAATPITNVPDTDGGTDESKANQQTAAHDAAIASATPAIDPNMVAAIVAQVMAAMQAAK